MSMSLNQAIYSWSLIRHRYNGADLHTADLMTLTLGVIHGWTARTPALTPLGGFAIVLLFEPTEVRRLGRDPVRN